MSFRSSLGATSSIVCPSWRNQSFRIAEAMELHGIRNDLAVSASMPLSSSESSRGIQSLNHSILLMLCSSVTDRCPGWSWRMSANIRSIRLALTVSASMMLIAFRLKSSLVSETIAGDPSSAQCAQNREAAAIQAQARAEMPYFRTCFFFDSQSLKYLLIFQTLFS